MAQTQFDATAPYQAPELPKVQEAQPSPLPPPSSQGFSVAPSKAGGIASIADNIMRGFMQGRAAAQESKAKKQANTTNALQASYNLAAQNLHKIVESNNLTQDQLQTIMKGGVPQGVDQATIDSLKQANQAVQGSWQAWTTWLGQHVEQEPGTGKKGTKGKNKGENLPFLQRLSQGISGKDPAEVSKAIYDFYVKNGPPIYSSLASVTANAKQRADAVKAEGVQTSAATAQAQETVDVDKLKSRERELMLKPNPTEDEKSELERTRSALESISVKPGDEKKRIIDDLTRRKANGEKLTPEEESILHPAGSSGVKVGSLGEFIQKAYGPNPTAEQELEAKRKWSPTDTVGTHMIEVPQPDGSIKTFEVTTSSHKTSGAGASPKSSDGGTTDGHAKPGETIGGKMTPDQVKAREDVEASTKLASLAYQAMTTGDAVQQRNLVLSLIRTMAGRVNMNEYKIYTSELGIPNKIESLINHIAGGGQYPKGLVLQLGRTAQSILKASKEAESEAFKKNVPSSASDAKASPQTHIFDSLAWKAANPNGDVEAAKKTAKEAGYEVK